jgi:hypothetical protein
MGGSRSSRGNANGERGPNERGGADRDERRDQEPSRSSRGTADEDRSRQGKSGQNDRSERSARGPSRADESRSPREETYEDGKRRDSSRDTEEYR